MKISTLIVTTIIILIMLVIAYAIFIQLPFHIYTDAECLEKGFPEYRVTYNLNRYCLTMDGAVSIKVNEL